MKGSRSMSLAGYLRLSSSVIVLLAGAAIGSFSYQTVKKSKTRDTWAIQFLEMEGISRGIADKLEESLERIIGQHRKLSPTIEVQYAQKENGKQVSGRKLSQENIPSRKKMHQFLNFSYNIISLYGETFMVIGEESSSPDSYVLRYWPISLTSWFGQIYGRNRDSRIYIANRDGKLIYSNSNIVTELTLPERPLIQRFVEFPLVEAQTPYVSKGGDKYFGYYSEIPRSNIVLFCETPESIIVSSILKLNKKILGVILLVLLAVLGLIQLSLRRLTVPISELVSVAEQISRGSYEIKIVSTGFGEIRHLGIAFTTMARNLVAREARIEKLIVEEKERVRLDGELAIAAEIQENFLPDFGSSQPQGVILKSEYIPADSVAGDWFGHHYFEDSGHYLLAIGDVSGHGAGASMFTALLAGVFKTCLQDVDYLSFPEVFLRRLNSVFIDVGRKKWHVTMQLLLFEPDFKSLTLTNAGHPFPILIKGGSSPKVERLKASSSPVGLFSDTEFKSKKFQLGPKSTIFLYTDGLVEALNPEGRQLSIRKLSKILLEASKRKPADFLSKVNDGLASHSQGVPLNDDVCMVYLKVL